MVDSSLQRRRLWLRYLLLPAIMLAFLLLWLVVQGREGSLWLATSLVLVLSFSLAIDATVRTRRVLIEEDLRRRYGLHTASAERLEAMIEDEAITIADERIAWSQVREARLVRVVRERPWWQRGLAQASDANEAFLFVGVASDHDVHLCAFHRPHGSAQQVAAELVAAISKAARQVRVVEYPAMVVRGSLSHHDVSDALLKAWTLVRTGRLP